MSSASKQKKTVLDNLFKKMPPNLQCCREYLVLIDELIVCVLCCKAFPLYINDQEIVTLKQLNDHLYKDGHRKRDLELMPVGVDKLFNNVSKGKFHHKIYISKNHETLFCNLCDIIIDVTHDELRQLNSLNNHLEGPHKDIFFKELMQYLPNQDSVPHLVCKSNQIHCNLCSTNVRINLDMENTIYNLKRHVLTTTHCNKLNKNGSSGMQHSSTDGYEEFLINDIFSNIPEINRRYFMMIRDGTLYCQLCCCYLPLTFGNILNHVKNSVHAMSINIVTSPIIRVANKIEDRIKLMEERNKINSENKYNIVESDFINNQMELRPLYIEKETNTVYSKLMSVLHPDLKQILEENRCYIYLKSCKCICALCFERMEPEDFFEHLNDLTHLDRVKADRTLFPTDDAGQSYEHLKLIFDPKSFQTVDKNFSYLQRIGNVYLCTLCLACFQVEPDLRLNLPNDAHLRNSVIDSFSQHFKGYGHILAVKDHNKEQLMRNGNKLSNVVNEELDSPDLDSENLSHDLAKHELDVENIEESAIPGTVNYNPLLNDSLVAVYEAYKVLCDVFKSDIPEVIDLNVEFFVKKSRRFIICVLCNKDVTLDNDDVTMENILSMHLKSKKHMDAFKSYIESSDQLFPLKDDLKQRLSFNLVYKSLTDIFGSTLPAVIEKNKNILFKIDKGLVCKLCGSLIIIPTIPNNQILNFSKHFGSTKHKQCYRNFKNELLMFEKNYLNTNRCRQKHNLKKENLSETVPDSVKTTRVEKISIGDKNDLPARSFNSKSKVNNSTIDAGFSVDKKSLPAFTEDENFSSKSKERENNTMFAFPVEINKVPVTNVVQLFEKNKTTITSQPSEFKGDLNKIVGKTKADLNSVTSISSSTFDKSTMIKEESTVSSVEIYLRKLFDSDIPKIIKDNQQFLALCDKGCLCKLCDVVMEVSSRTISNFTQHLKSHRHRLMRYSTNSASPNKTFCYSSFTPPERQNVDGTNTFNSKKPRNKIVSNINPLNIGQEVVTSQHNFNTSKTTSNTNNLNSKSNNDVYSIKPVPLKEPTSDKPTKSKKVSEKEYSTDSVPAHSGKINSEGKGCSSESIGTNFVRKQFLINRSTSSAGKVYRTTTDLEGNKFLNFAPGNRFSSEGKSQSSLTNSGGKQFLNNKPGSTLYSEQKSNITTTNLEKKQFLNNRTSSSSSSERTSHTSTPNFGGNRFSNQKVRLINSETNSPQRNATGIKTNKTKSNISKSEDLEKIINRELPEIIKTNLKYLIRRGNKYVCIICEKFIMCTSNPEITLDNFTKHLIGKYHLENVTN